MIIQNGKWNPVCPGLEMERTNKSIGAFARPISSTSGVLLVLILCLHPYRHTHSLHRHNITEFLILGPLWVNSYLSNAIGPPCYPCFSCAVMVNALRTVFCCLHAVSTVIRDYGYYAHQKTVSTVSFFLSYPPPSLPFIREQTED